MPSRSEKQWRHHEENKAMRKVRKQIKRNRKTKRTRRKDWLPDSLDLNALDDLDFAQDERVMPRGERERRQTVINEALARIREEEQEKEPPTHSADSARYDENQGMVVEVSSSMCRVELDGQTLLCGLRGSLSAEDTGYTNVVAVGDQVIVSPNGGEQGIVEEVLPRSSILSRPDPFYNHLKQAVVANAEQLLIVASWHDPAFWPALVDRYLIAAERSYLVPILCVNKVDLAGEIGSCHAAVQPYKQLGHRVLLTSALCGIGVEELAQTLAGRTTILAGLSGVGKSSLLNVVQPGLHLRTGEVSERLKMGRHTTTQVNLFKLDLGGYVIDTPGIRDFGLDGLLRTDLIDYYPGIRAAAKGCRFSDCSHSHEPGCAVQAAVQSGTLSETRFQSYMQIFETLPASRAEKQEQAQARAWR